MTTVLNSYCIETEQFWSKRNQYYRLGKPGKLEKLLEKPPLRAEFLLTCQIHLLSPGQLWTFPDKNWHNSTPKRDQIFVIQPLEKLYTKGHLPTDLENLEKTAKTPPRRAKFSPIFADSYLQLSSFPGENWDNLTPKYDQIFIIQPLEKLYTKGHLPQTNTGREIGDLLHPYLSGSSSTD